MSTSGDGQAMVWRKSSFSGQNNNTCIEVAGLAGGGRAVRDSKDPSGPMLRFAAAEWAGFVRATKTGQFD